MLLDVVADFVAILIRHDHVGDHGVRRNLVKLLEREAASAQVMT